MNRYWSKEDVKGCDKEDIMTETIPTIENSFIAHEDVSIEAFIPTEVDKGENFSLF